MRSDFETIIVSRYDNQILLVTLNRPEVSNALNTRMGLDLMELFETLSIDLEGLRAVIITGSGNKAFCAGGDLKERNGMTDESWQSQHVIFERMVRAMMDVQSRCWPLSTAQPMAAAVRSPRLRISCTPPQMRALL